MAKYPQAPGKPGPPLFTRMVAAQLARVSLEFLSLCEAQDLLRPRELAGGEPGYSFEDIQRLVLIRRFHDLLGLDLEAVEVVLHLREQVLYLRARMEEMERRFTLKEKELLEEIESLRRRLAVLQE
jgi:DNA-binding transcriptional MerR regulator